MLLITVAVQAPDMYSGEVRSALRADVIGVVLGTLFASTGAICAGFAFVRGARRYAGILWFGLFLMLYGMRMDEPVRIAKFLTPGLSPTFWDYYKNDVNYVIPVIALLLLRELTKEWRKILRWLLWTAAAFGVIEIIAEAMLRRPGALSHAGNMLALLGLIVAAIRVFSPGGRQRWPAKLRLGLGIFMATALLANLGGLKVLPLQFNPEPLGFAVLMGIVGGMVIAQIVQKEERLLSFDKEMEIARQIQTSILPAELPEGEALTMVARYLPMTSVAGDFYDVLRVDAQRVGILIADVSGHGVAAALIASMVKVAIAAQSAHADDPAKVLGGMNQILCGKLKAQFVTAAYVFVNLEAGTFRYGAAGHPALLWQTEGGIVAVEENGLPLGLMSFAAYGYVESRLAAWSRLVMYTDGLPEASDPASIFFGEERMREVIGGAAGATPGDCADALLAGVRKWTGGRDQEDDLTVLVVDVRSSSAG